MFQNTHNPGFETFEFQNIFIYSTPQVPKQCILINNFILQPLREVEKHAKIVYFFYATCRLSNIRGKFWLVLMVQSGKLLGLLFPASSPCPKLFPPPSPASAPLKLECPKSRVIKAVVVSLEVKSELSFFEFYVNHLSCIKDFKELHSINPLQSSKVYFKIPAPVFLRKYSVIDQNRAKHLQSSLSVGKLASV